MAEGEAWPGQAALIEHYERGAQRMGPRSRGRRPSKPWPGQARLLAYYDQRAEAMAGEPEPGELKV